MLKNRRVAAVIVAAGKSSRMGFDKLLLAIEGTEVLRLAVEKFDAHPAVDELVVVAGDNLDVVRVLFADYPPQKPLRIVRGGATRAHSVATGVLACPEASLVAIHDAARPFVSQAVISRALEAAAETGAAAPAVAVKDTIKQMDDGLVAATPPRHTLAAVQTPQVFDRAAFLQALSGIPVAEYAVLTDDCMVMERVGMPVRLVEGEEANYKITTPQDLPGQTPAQKVERPLPWRVGHGYDVHRLAAGLPLVLGGVQIPFEKGLQGHSDADVLLHAVTDALLGAAALGDIGSHFPDSDDAYKGADSLELLKKAAKKVRQAGYQMGNVDATLLCQAPKLAPHIGTMRHNIAGALAVPAEAVSVKATTEEGLGFTGSGEGIAAHCVVILAAN